uniref:Small ribosomal subunit protein mS39 n=1 Tax=Pelusios castaneus TaxID=367368 RepID=A0A8C8RGW4_9SAUR
MHRTLNMAARCLLRRSGWPQVMPLRGRGSGRLPSAGKGASSRHCSGSASFQKTEAVPGATEEEIVIPRKKTWDKLAVLQTLASTVNMDPTASPYTFHDDPYLLPRNSFGTNMYYLAKESGKNAAKYIVNEFPEFFKKDIAEPHIPCLMPENIAPQIEEVSEAALKERIQLRKVKASVDMFDHLLQTGTPISLETTNSLLDLLCFYGDREPIRESQLEPEEEKLSEEEKDSEEAPNRRIYSWKTSNFIGHKWRENNNAERIFNLMPERNAHSYCTMIRGMVKHGAGVKAHGLYRDLLNNRHTADVHTFNALILAVTKMSNRFTEKWELVKELLNHMVEQNVQPNLLTFNSVLKILKYCGHLGKILSVQTLREMKVLNIEPSLATFKHVLDTFYKTDSLDIIYDVMKEIEGKSFVVRDPDDTSFFARAMLICFSLKDVELAYRLDKVFDTGDHWKLVRDVRNQNAYYRQFFSLLCLMEQLDVVLKWYKEHVPSHFHPDSQSMWDLLQALDTASRLEMIPEIWKEMKELGFIKRSQLLEEMVALMARERHPEETQISFANCAAEIKFVFETEEKFPLEWTESFLKSLTLLFARVGRTQEAWNMLELFEKNGKVPSDTVMNEVLSCLKQSNDPDKAIDLVELAAAFGLPTAASLRRRVTEEFELSEEQKKALDFPELQGVI